MEQRFKKLKTWENAPDAMRHMQWNSMMVRELGIEIATFCSNLHETEWLMESGYISFTVGTNIYTKLNQVTLMDIWNNEIGRTLGSDPELMNLNYTELFNYALTNNYLITDATKVYEMLGILDYVNDDWTINAIWSLETQTVTVFKEGYDDIVISMGVIS